MDPHTTLGISRYANEDELKRAFRKEAMKWHPDRAGSSPEAKIKFQEISHAYQVLSREIRSKNRQENSQSHTDQTPARDAEISDDDVFRDVLLEYAVGLIQSGMTRREVRIKVAENGCDEATASSIADQAFKFQQEFPDNFNGRKNSRPNPSGINKRKFDYLSIQGLLGKQNPNDAGRKTISDYHEIFNNLYEKDEAGAVFPTSKNKYLSKIFNRSILLFLVIACLAYYFPGLTGHIPLGLIDFFQLPNVILSLMLIWSVYRKLWLLSSIGIALFALTQIFYYYSMPIALERDFTTILFISIACYLPFIFLAHLSNFFYYKKARHIIESVNHLYPHLDEKHLLVKGRGGVSRLSALFFTMLLSLYFLHMIPENGTLDNKFNDLFSINTKTEGKEIRQIKARISESERLFMKAEQHFNQNPPEYQNAEAAYTKSANYGSLLSSYKLGYMYFAGKGVTQDDIKAFQYFNHAIHSPLASQPHSISEATKWLSESYNSLGIMYLGGYGTTKNKQKAREMFRQALKYGASNRMDSVMQVSTFNTRNLRAYITLPEYSR